MPVHLALKTPLSSLAIPYLDLVLDDLFLLPGPAVFAALPPQRLETIEDLILATGLEQGEVLDLLKGFMILSEGVAMKAQEVKRMDRSASFSDKCPILLDLRPKECADVNLNLRVQRWDDLDFYDFFQMLDASGRSIIAFCLDGKRSFSMAMHLRQKGIASAFFLEGGVKSLEA